MKTQSDKPNTDDNNSRPLAENEQIGAQLAHDNPINTAGRTAGKNAVPQSSHTPNYGDFGHAPLSDEEMNGPVAAGTNPGGAAAPSTPAPDQRGAAPQNLAPGAVRATMNDETDERREAAKLDDPRYGSGTRNWETAEPANRTKQSDIDTNEAYQPAAN
jgi:hypothetical protein